MVVGTWPRPPHFAPYIRHFARKLDSRLHGSMSPQTVLPTTTTFSPFHFCRMYQAKRPFFTKVALSLTRESLFSYFSRSLGLAQMYSIDLVWYIRHFRPTLHSLSCVCQGFMPIVRHSHAKPLFFHYKISLLSPRREHRFPENIAKTAVVTHILYGLLPPNGPTSRIVLTLTF